MSTTIYSIVLVLSLTLAAQGAFTLYLMLYTWMRPDRLAATRSPETFLPPRFSFTAILPARHEQEVIAQTIKRVWAADYPKDLLEVVVVCEHTDDATIAEARRAADEIGHPNVRVITFSDGPINKPHGLNVALRGTSHGVVTIFDAEDDVHPAIFQIINTLMQQSDAGIVQAGVQLMDFQSSWFSMHNVLEYFFWFKSRLHFHAKVGAVPLGGNTVFMKRALLEQVGGWDEQCLTEDADVGLRLSVLSERIAITYDAEHATREETPPTVASFIKQRTRWNQGFLQVLGKGDWWRLPTLRQRLLAGYTLVYPFAQAFVGILWLPTFAMMFTLKVPVGLAMLSVLPFYGVVFQFVTNLVGLFEFAKLYGLRVRARDVAIFTLGFLPYQVLLSLGAIRAVYRQLRRLNNWEKTEHTGAHRQPEAVPVPAAPRTVPMAALQSAVTAPIMTTAQPSRIGNRSRRRAPAPVALPNGLPRLLTEAQQQLGAERASVMVLDRAANAFSIYASHGLSNDIVRSTRQDADAGVVGWVAQTGSPLLINSANPPQEIEARLRQPDLRTALLVPIEQEGQTVAVVSVSSTDRALGQDELRWLDRRVRSLVKYGHTNAPTEQFQVA